MKLSLNIDRIFYSVAQRIGDKAFVAASPVLVQTGDDCLGKIVVVQMTTTMLVSTAQ